MSDIAISRPAYLHVGRQANHGPNPEPAPRPARMVMRALRCPTELPPGRPLTFLSSSGEGPPSPRAQFGGFPGSSRSRPEQHQEMTMSHDAGFGTIGVSTDLCEALAAQGIDAPFPIQTLVMPA